MVEELASPTEVASPSLALPPSDAENEQGLFRARYLVVYTHNRRCARLHLTEGCWRDRQLSFASVKHLDEDPPPREAHNAICRGCWPSRTGDDLEDAKGEGGVEGSDTTLSTDKESC